MKIKINGVVHEVYEYDDDNTLLERYTLSQPDSLSSFYRIENEDFILKDGLSLTVTSVRDSISKLNAEDLADQNIVDSILLSYPNLKRREIGILWILDNYEIANQKPKPISAEDLEYLKKLDRIAFLSQTKAQSTVEDFLKGIKRQRDEFSAKINKEKSIFTSVTKHRETIQPGPFSLEEISARLILRIPNGENLIDIFDALEPSKNVPFIILARKRKIYYKIFKHIPPPMKWIDYVPPAEGIYFKILNISSSGMSTRQIMIDNLYSDGVWTPDNRIELDFMIRQGVKEEDIRMRLFSALGDRVDYEIVTSRQMGIKGVFTISNVDFDKPVFSDFVATNPIFRYFLFLNEKTKTVLAKPRFYAYYAPDQQGEISTSLGLTITPLTKDGINSVVIRISHALNLQQANSAKLIITKLISMYLQDYEQIAKIYETIIPTFKRMQTGKVAKPKKEDKKTGPRAVALRKAQPEMFGSRYPDQCQKERQPYILKTEEEARRRAEDLGDPHKIMKFEGVWYACEPREPYLDPSGNKDKDDKHIFPGLKENKPKTKDTEHDKEYHKKYKYLPCCFTQDQYEKKASNLRKYNEKMVSGKTDEIEERESGAGYIIGANKRLPPGRLGEVPFNWEKLLGYLGMKKIIRGKQEFYPILRYGVMQTPDSFIHCLERAFNPRYSIITNKEKKDQVDQIRAEWADSNLGIARQELYNYTHEDIEEILLNSDEYVAPEDFISLAQKYYECNIFIYVVNTKHENGDIVIPRNSQAYLTRDIDETKKTVLIVKYETETNEYPYQCEIFCQLDEQDGKIRNIDCVFENSPVVEMATKLFYEANEVFVVSPDGYEPYSPVPEIGV